MLVYKFRVVLEQDDTIYRDVELKPAQFFSDFNDIILKAFAFDNKHEASFYSTNDNWVMGEEISLNKKDGIKLMSKIPLAQFIDDPHQKFIYVYDYAVEWNFLIELMTVTEVTNKETYPRIVKTEGIAPKQYGNEPIAEKEVERFETEEIYDASETDEMGEEGEDTDASDDENQDEFGDDEYSADDSAGSEEY
ncbi:MAG: hypothetical protein RIQ33_1752 [Bacteroidota bacterium]|jgi:hypothetical protein